MANIHADSRFSLAPSIGNVQRSRFVRDQKTVTSFDVGRCIPFYVDEVLPGDTAVIDTSMIVRLQTLLTPIFDDIILDKYYFYVPARLTWTHWKEFMGENTASAWIPQVEYSIPQITAPSGGWNVGTIADYFGIPTGVGDISVSALPFRALALCYNYFFRDENLTDPLNIPTGDSTQSGSNGDSYVNDVANGGKPFKAAKFHDYFTSALPSPQKGPEVSINLSNLPETMPVVGNGKALALVSQTDYTDPSGRGVLANYSQSPYLYINKNQTSADVGDSMTYQPGNMMTDTKAIGVATRPMLGVNNLEKSGLIADLRSINTESVISIAELRTAVAIQQFYESLSRNGSRYSEILRGQFGVISPDARLQNPEYLGGSRFVLNISQNVQSSETNTTPQGNVTGYSVTADTHSDFTKSFTEHGFIIGIMVARYKHTYQQGIEKMWSRKTRFDYYWPKLAGLSEMPILNKEIFAQGSLALDSDGNVIDEKVFGFQEPWAEYRHKPNKITGEMRSTYATSLDVWHLGDDYNALPALSDNWIREDETTVDRVIAVSSRTSNQLMADIYVKNVMTRPMPVYGVPGLTRL